MKVGLSYGLGFFSALLLSLSSVAYTQPVKNGLQSLQGVNAEELSAWQMVQKKPIAARRKAEKIVRKNPSSFVAHLALGHVFHFHEANFPRALFHLNRSLDYFENRFGSQPTRPGPWQWHAMLLQSLANTHYSLEHFDEQIRYINTYNRFYDPDMIAQKAWPLMKLRRFDEARLAARAGLKTNLPDQRSISLNALCALEFESGNDERSYRYCKKALDYGLKRFGAPSAVDYTNFAEASRSVFALQEAEYYSLEATKVGVSWYSNPWLDLAELYTRQARFAEAVSALKSIGEYRMKRPAHTRYIDQAEVWRAAAALLLLAGEGEDGARTAEQGVLAPDRRAHASRDPRQDQLVLLLLQRASLKTSAEKILEEGSVGPWWKRPSAWFRSSWRSLVAWYGGRKVRKIFDEDLLSGTFRIGSASSSVMPPWLVGDLIDTLGSTVVRSALKDARSLDKRRNAGGYYDAFTSEIAAANGESKKVVFYAKRALRKLPPGEVMLGTRVRALLAEHSFRLFDFKSASASYAEVLGKDPGVLRRLGLSLPVRIHAANDYTQGVAEGFVRTSRMVEHPRGVRLFVEIQGKSVIVRLTDAKNQGLVRCAVPKKRLNPEDVARECLPVVFSAKVDFQSLDVNSLDAANTGKRDGLRELLQ